MRLPPTSATTSITITHRTSTTSPGVAHQGTTGGSYSAASSLAACTAAVLVMSTSSAWTSPVPFPYHLDTPSQPPTTSQPAHPIAQPHLRTKRNRPPHEPHPTTTTSSLLFTPASPTPPSSTPMSDGSQSHSAKGRLAAAGFPPLTAPSTTAPAFFSPTSAPSFSAAALPPSSVRRLPGGPLSAATLRALVHRYLATHQESAAIFYADKLCSLVPPSSAALPSPTAFPPLSRLLLLATALHRKGEHRRAIHVLRHRSVVCSPHTLSNSASEMDDLLRWIDHGGDGDDEADDTPLHPPTSLPSHGAIQAPAASTSSPQARARLVLSCRHLLALCLFHCRDYDEALLAMAPDDAALVALLARYEPLLTTQPALLSSLCFLRAEVYSQQQHRTRALTWYLRCLHLDAACTAAFDRVVEGRMLSWADERAMMQGLRFDDGMEWLQLVYWNKIEQFSAAEDEPPSLPDPSDVPMTPVGRKDDGRQGVVGRLTLLTTDCGVVDNVELYTSLVYRLYHRYDFTAALALSSRLLTADPYNPHLLPLHLLLLANTANTSHLFYISHQLSTSLPTSPLSSYAIALYYSSTHKHELARKFFSRASTVDPLFLPAYLGFAHAFAAQEEGDQALIAYRTAARLFEGSHLPLLCLGVEYARAGNIPVAEELLKESLRIYPADPLTLNELGVVAYRRGQWEEAGELFHRALGLIAVTSSAASVGAMASAWEAGCVNLGHARRKQGRYGEALVAYQQALAPPAVAGMQALEGGRGGMGDGAVVGVSGGSGGAADEVHRAVLTAMGFTYHLMGDAERAIQHYHQALASAPRDTLTSDLLNRALQEVAERPLRLDKGSRTDKTARGRDDKEMKA